MALRIALTGASGFVGRAVTPKLLDAGHAVRVLLRNPRAAPQPAAVEVVEGDLSSATALQRLTQGCDVVLHVAGAIAGLTPADFMAANGEGTARLVAAARVNGVKRFVYLSSLAAREPQLSAYAASKRAGEDAAQAVADAMQVLVLRPAAVYGEGDKATLPLLAALTSRVGVLPGTRGQRFSMIHVDDLARICVEAVSSPITGVREVDDGADGYGWDNLIAISRALYGRPGVPVLLPQALAMAVGQGGDAVARLRGKPGMVSAAKMRELYFPNWVAQGPGWPRANPIPFAEGLPRTVAWYQAQGLLPRLPQVAKSGRETGSQVQ